MDQPPPPRTISEMASPPSPAGGVSRSADAPNPVKRSVLAGLVAIVSSAVVGIGITGLSWMIAAMLMHSDLSEGSREFLTFFLFGGGIVLVFLVAITIACVTMPPPYRLRVWVASMTVSGLAIAALVLYVREAVLP